MKDEKKSNSRRIVSSVAAIGHIGRMNMAEVEKYAGHATHAGWMPPPTSLSLGLKMSRVDGGVSVCSSYICMLRLGASERTYSSGMRTYSSVVLTLPQSSVGQVGVPIHPVGVLSSLGPR